MVAIESHHYETPRRKALRRVRIQRPAHAGRAETWRWIVVGLLVFWALVAYGIHSIA